MNNATFIHEKITEVKWSDMDALGHVNNARYFSYLEDCRSNWFASQSLSLSPANSNISVVLVHVEADFILPIVYPANVLVRMYADAPGRSSMKTYYEICDADQPQTLYAKSQAVLVWFDLTTQKSAPVSHAVRDLF